MPLTCMNNNADMDTIFEGVFQKLVDPAFATKLGGELPLFIQPIPNSGQSDLDSQVQRLTNRLSKKGEKAMTINLYNLCIKVLDEEGILQTILEEEQNLERQDIISTIDSILDIKTVIIRRISDLISEQDPEFVFITGVGRAYPFIRSHGVLNNIDELSKHKKLVLFFPGKYDNLQLSLFGIINDENYYRGHNLNDIK